MSIPALSFQGYMRAEFVLVGEETELVLYFKIDNDNWAELLRALPNSPIYNRVYYMFFRKYRNLANSSIMQSVTKPKSGMSESSPVLGDTEEVESVRKKA